MTKRITKYIRFIQQSIEIIGFQILSLFYKRKKDYQNLWLFCERGYDAQDNALLLFQYVSENLPQQNIAFLLKKPESKIGKEIAKFGKVISFGSFEHKMAFTLAQKSFSTHVGFVEPWNLKLYKLLTPHSLQYVFLQHGVIYNDVSQYLNQRIAPVDVFIISSELELNNLQKPEYGYTKSQLKLTGLARFDRLIQHKNDAQNQITFMPSWQRNIHSEKEFLDSEFYQKTTSLLHNKQLLQLLENYNFQLNFILHPEFRKFQNAYENLNDKIKFLDTTELKIQDLIISSQLLITDYSSIFFDFSFLNRPVLFYQYAEFHNYKSTHFDFQKFGKVSQNEDSLIAHLSHYFQNHFQNLESFTEYSNEFFTYKDDQNCKRILECVENLL